MQVDQLVQCRYIDENTQIAVLQQHNEVTSLNEGTYVGDGVEDASLSQKYSHIAELTALI